jgi:uncharacterized damage-inducible protein DinB
MDPALNHCYIASHTEGLTSQCSPKVFRLPLQSKNESEQNMIKRLSSAAAIAILACTGATAARAQEVKLAKFDNYAAFFSAFPKQEVTATEKEKTLQYLEKTKQGVLDAVKGLSDAQWNFKAGPDRWSIAQCMEHIAAAEDYIRGLVIEKVMLAPAVPGRDVQATDDAILAKIPDRSKKAQAPEPIVPTNRYGSPDASIKHFVESRDKTEEFLKTTPGLRDHAVDGPTGGKMDAYEFILLIAAHSERHTKQILEVKADPNYPKN